MLKPRQQGHALNWSSPCLLRDDISTGGSNQCDTLTEPLRQIASSLPARSDLHFGDKTTHYYCLAFSVGPCFVTFVVTCSPSAATSPMQSTTWGGIAVSFFVGEIWNLCFIHDWLLPYVTAEHLCKVVIFEKNKILALCFWQTGTICWSLLIRWSAGLSSRATMSFTFVVLSEIWTIGWIVVKNLVQTFMLPTGEIVIMLLLP